MPTPRHAHNYGRHRAARRNDRGASAVEYGLMVAAIAAVVVGVVFGLGTLVQSAFSKTCAQFASSAEIDVSHPSCDGQTVAPPPADPGGGDVGTDPPPAG